VGTKRDSFIKFSKGYVLVKEKQLDPEIFPLTQLSHFTLVALFSSGKSHRPNKGASALHQCVLTHTQQSSDGIVG